MLLTAGVAEIVGWGAGILAIITVSLFASFSCTLAVESILCRKYAGLAPVRITRKSETTNQNVIICVPLGPRAEILLFSEASAPNAK